MIALPRFHSVGRDGLQIESHGVKGGLAFRDRGAELNKAETAIHPHLRCDAGDEQRAKATLQGEFKQTS